ncbi:Hypothetical Protein U712_16000 [Bacillus subtilis PY79]|nr:Hypothetical Protein U712_16000 [Bacillus subtilis PY79]
MKYIEKFFVKSLPVALLSCLSGWPKKHSEKDHFIWLLS